jgi:hypothetical protein
VFITGGTLTEDLLFLILISLRFFQFVSVSSFSGVVQLLKKAILSAILFLALLSKISFNSFSPNKVLFVLRKLSTSFLTLLQLANISLQILVALIMVL